MAAPAAAAHAEAVADEVLLERLEAGDTSAFDELYGRYYPRVYNFLSRRMGNRADIEETTQDVFLNLVQSLHSYRREAPFGAWVFGVTRRTLANRFKRRRFDTVSLPDDDADPMGLIPAEPASPDPHEAYACQERLARMVRVAERLSPIQRTVFELHHLEFRSIRDIARVTRRSEDSVKSHLYRARRSLLA